jgi:hypothetical protein
MPQLSSSTEFEHGPEWHPHNQQKTRASCLGRQPIRCEMVELASFDPGPRQPRLFNAMHVLSSKPDEADEQITTFLKLYERQDAFLFLCPLMLPLLA